MKRYDPSKYKAFTPVGLTDRTWPDKVISKAPTWCSVDLRDGNQALIEPMSVSQKRMMFALLVDVGFKEIEVGFPAASQPDFDFVRWLIEADQVPDDVTIQVLTQARTELIERTYESLKGAKKAIVHLYNSTSVVQREKVFKLDKEGIKDIAVNGAKNVLRCAQAAPETEWFFQYSPESFTGTELEYAVEVCNAVNEIWQPTPEHKVIINLPATVEVATPNVYADQIEWFCRHIKNRDAIVLSLHTHNDRGCGVAASELGLMAGADRVEGTLLGNGERTGNLDIVIMGMNMYSQGIHPELDFSGMDHICTVVKECTQIEVHPRQAYAGSLVFTAFSGSHQDAIKKCLDIYKEGETWEIAYLPIDPRDVGRTYQDVIRVNSQSGKGGVAYVMDSKFGFHLPRWLQIEFSRIVQKVTEDSGQEIQPEQIYELFQQQYLELPSPLLLKSFTIEKAEHETIGGKIELEGELFEVSGKGSGMLEAFVDALEHTFGMELQILEYGEHALSQSANADAVTYLQVKYEGRRYTGIAIDEDIVTSSVNALLNAVSQVLHIRRQEAA
ncbi:MAG: 2-isopropylmalate synthase [Gammaproteobacteria bacterium]|nr:2-isopropylmalate synthase [Gammaproteobacteria bacterium]